MHEEKSRNRVLSNIIFYLGIWAKTFPWGLVFIFTYILSTVFSIYYQIRIPQILIRGIELKLAANDVLSAVFNTFLLMTLCKIVFAISQTKVMTGGSRPLSWLYTVPVHKKLFTIPYEQLISAPVQNSMVKLENMVSRGGNGGPIHFFGVKLGGFFAALLGMVIFTANIIYINPLLLVAMFVSTALHLVYGIYAGNYTERNMRERSDSEKKERYIIRTVEDRHYSKDIRLFNLLPHLKQLFAKYHDLHAAYLKKESTVQAGNLLVSALAVLVRDGLSYIYLTHRLLSGNMPISEFVYLSALVTHFSAWMNHIVQNANELIISSAQLQQFRDFIDMEVPESPGKLTAADVSNQPAIEFRNISYHYPESKKYIFENFSLKINAGENIALVGINGAGKTTLMHLLMGLLEPVEGKILIDNLDSKDFPKEEYYRLFSPVFQDITVFPESILRNISGSTDADREKVEKVIETAGFKEYVDSLEAGLETKLVRDAAENAIDLSGGLNQRMLLARALYKNAPINILDEPTAALDPLAESRMYEEYDAMSKGKTTIFISHRLASTRFCDRILFLENGKILEEGSHEDLMAKRGHYYEMFEAQSAYYQEGVCYDS